MRFRGGLTLFVGLVTGFALGFSSASLLRHSESREKFSERLGDALAEHDRVHRMGSLYGLVMTISAKNGQEAAEAALKLDHVEEKDFVIDLVLAEWAVADPHAALAYAQELKRPQERKLAVCAVVKGWARKDCLEVQKWVDTLSAGDLKRQAQQIIIDQIAETDPENALNIVQSSTAAFGLSSLYVEQIFGNWAASNPEVAAARAASLPSGKLHDQAVKLVAIQWAQRDPSSASTWVQQLSSSQQRNNTLSATLNIWMDRDSEGALAWVQKQPGSAQLNDIISRMVSQLASIQPQKAILVVQQMRPGNEQVNAIRKVGRKAIRRRRNYGQHSKPTLQFAAIFFWV